MPSCAGVGASTKSVVPFGSVSDVDREAKLFKAAVRLSSTPYKHKVMATRSDDVKKSRYDRY